MKQDDEDSCFVNHSNKKEKKMKGLKRLAGVLGADRPVVRYADGMFR